MTIDGVDAIHEEGGIFQNGFAHHYAVNARFGYAFRHILETANASVRKHRNGELFADGGNGLPVASSCAVFVLLSRSSMDLRRVKRV